MNRIIPILPCLSVREQVAFYEQLGFETVELITRPYPYAVVRYDTLEIHFYVNKKMDPGTQASMCYVATDDVDQIYAAMTSNVKITTGKIPRTGRPRISKLKDLSQDRRFIITDVCGNTLFVGTPNTEHSLGGFYRTLDNPQYAAHFKTLYDLTYSKEDYDSASKMLEKFFPSDLHSIQTDALDLAKILLVAIDLHTEQNGEAPQDMHEKIRSLMHANDVTQAPWQYIAQRYDRRSRGD